MFFIEENEEKTFYSCEGEIYTEEVNIVNEELIWEQDGYTKGNVVGYTRCMDFVGYFIITEQRDSLLTFNLLSSSINIDFDTLKPGAYAMRWVNIKFDYRLAIGDEIKQNSEILCSQLIGVGGPPPPGRFEDYVQTIITDIKE